MPTRMPTPQLLSAKELTVIAARLSERADEIQQITLRDLTRDLRLAAQCVERLAHIRAEISQIADKCKDVETVRELRDVLGDTGED